MPDDDVIVDVPPTDEPLVDVVKTEEPKVEKVEAKVETPKDEGIDDLKAQLEERTAAQERDRVARANAENEARQARDESARLRTEASGDRLAAIDGAISAEKSTIDSAKRELRQLWEAGDYEKAAEVQEKISLSAARLIRFDEAKSDIEAQVKAPARTETEHSDPFERAIAKNTPRAKDWLRGHKDYVTDPKLNMKANAAHSMAVSEGFIPDTDAYFDYCEKFLGLKEKDKTVEPVTPRTRTRTMPAAPVSRDSSGAAATNGGSSASQVTLSPGEQRAATDGTLAWQYNDPNGKFKKGDPIGIREFARRKASMTKEGRYDRSFTDQ